MYKGLNSMKKVLSLIVIAVLLYNFPIISLAESVTVTNPIVKQRADPWVFRHDDGYYYMTASVPEYDRVELRRSTTIQGLSTATPAVIWRRHASGIMAGHIWAPEIHFINGKWYIYFSAGTSENKFAIRLYVLECSDKNPVTGQWVEKGQLKTNWESFTLDATTFEHNGARYLVWAQSQSGISSNSNLYIAKMNGPLAISGNQVMITTPQYSWEKIGYSVNEGPAVIKKNGKIFITYSASATDFNYCIGMLTASASSDLLNPASWNKSPNPVFKTNEATNQYGPGHNCFTTSQDGTVDIIIYHSRNYKNITGDPLYDPNRHTRAQRLDWNPDGTPNFGVPAADGVTVITQALNPEDINGDKVVNMADVIIIAGYFNQPSSEISRKCDLNNDGVINMSDIIILAMKFNTVFE
jgi:GH43 family beta-xylosidase